MKRVDRIADNILRAVLAGVVLWWLADVFGFWTPRYSAPWWVMVWILEAFIFTMTALFEWDRFWWLHDTELKRLRDQNTQLKRRLERIENGNNYQSRAAAGGR